MPTLVRTVVIALLACAKATTDDKGIQTVTQAKEAARAANAKFKSSTSWAAFTVVTGRLVSTFYSILETNEMLGAKGLLQNTRKEPEKRSPLESPGNF